MSGAYIHLQDLVSLRFQAKDLPIFQTNNSRHIMTGGSRSPFKGRGIDFEEVRAYQFGDDIRSIDWRVTARRMKPHTKVFREERERPVIILLDQSHSLFFGSEFNFKSVTAAESAALLAWATLQHGDRIGGLIFNETSVKEVRPKRSKKTLMHLFNQTESMNNALSAASMPGIIPTGYFSKALRHVRQVAHPGTKIFLISDFSNMDEEASGHISRLSRHCEMMAIHITDPLEQELPVPDYYNITNGTHQQTLNTRQPGIRQQFRDQQERQTDYLTSEFARYRIPLLNLTASQPTTSQFMAYFGTGKKTGRRK